ncbi:Mobile element protein [Lactococcus lactis subsp. lactis]|uniref:Mobile element protein n=1 Tax=Lactococcus lactis subsp. lactis TaxID=1360 RepID=A0A0V8D6R7_LACLL|nr:hypothetical protein [Lactococcus lactis]KSU08785.1 Mobile element protein [Lactococcus lactis subsp. lactis]
MFNKIAETTRSKTNREKVEIMRSLRHKYTLTKLLKSVELSKSSYFYALNATKNRDIELENKICPIHQAHPNPNPITALLTREGMIDNEKRVLRILRKLQLLVTSFHHKSRKYSSYPGCVGKVAK